ncbi:unnamed protein product [Dicrocoelium dendriticum]|nr:unnamed protein product [Dicrocoelium dendriticum]
MPNSNLPTLPLGRAIPGKNMTCILRENTRSSASVSRSTFRLNLSECIHYLNRLSVARAPLNYQLQLLFNALKLLIALHIRCLAFHVRQQEAATCKYPVPKLISTELLVNLIRQYQFISRVPLWHSTLHQGQRKSLQEFIKTHKSKLPTDYLRPLKQLEINSTVLESSRRQPLSSLFGCGQPSKFFNNDPLGKSKEGITSSKDEPVLHRVTIPFDEDDGVVVIIRPIRHPNRSRGSVAADPMKH